MTIRFQNTFGMFEMEVAAEIIVQKAEEAGNWDITVALEDFLLDSDKFLLNANRRGFLDLLAYGWVVPCLLTKDNFKITADFISRVTPKIEKHINPLDPLRIR